MVLPFHRQPLLHKRYAYLSPPQNGRDEPSQLEDQPHKAGDEYANFLRLVQLLLFTALESNQSMIYPTECHYSSTAAFLNQYLEGMRLVKIASL